MNGHYNDTNTKDLNINVCSLNTRGLRTRTKRQSVFKWLKDKKFDLILLQETYCTKNIERQFNRDWNGSILHSFSDSNHSRGVSILVRKHLGLAICSTHSDDEGRLLLINGKLSSSEQKVTVVAAYAPNVLSSRIEFMKKTGKFIERFAHDDNFIILGGDLNTTDDMRDRSTGTTERCSTHFTAFKKFVKVTDVWRTHNPGKFEFSFVDSRASGSMSRIDYILCSSYLSQYIQASSMTCAPVPDHRAVTAHFYRETRPRGRGYWKLNISLLNDPEYVDGIQNIICQTLNEYSNAGVSKRNLWDFIKIRIKEFSIHFGIKKHRAQKSKIDCLESEINKIETTPNFARDINLASYRKNLKAELSYILEKKTRGAQIRSRSKWIEDGERNSSFFLRLENSRGSFNRIDSLKTEDGTQLTTDRDIIEEASKFYENLYSSQKPTSSSIDDYLKDITLKNSLSDSEKQECEGTITLDECDNVLKNMKLNKSPGLDGLPFEFYKTFWDNIKHTLIESYNESFLEGELSHSQKQSVLSLIFKKGDKENIRNYRPISLTNCDYKIVAFTLANRLQSVLDKLISHDQTGYIKKRYIGTNLRLIQDTIEFSQKHQPDAVVVMLDFQKAFDSVEWEFLFRTMKKFNFGIEFINWIKVLYKNANFCVKNNGWISDSKAMNRGIRQGCPISALLFILVVEVMATKLRDATDLKGIRVNTKEGQKEIKLSQYADDTTLMLQDATQIPKAIRLITEFGNYAGLKLNIEKTEALLLDPNKKLDDYKHLKIKFSHGPIKCLGIYVGGEKKERDTLNWEKNITNLERVIETWKQRDLSLFGKITVIKTLALPKVIFTATNTPIPHGISKRIERILFSAIWGKRDRIRRNVLCAPIDQGGLNMVDITSLFESLKASWLNRILLDNGQNTWSFLAKSYIEQIGGSVVCSQFNISDIKQLPIIYTIPDFYQEVICAHSKSNSTKAEQLNTKSQYLDMPLWGNINLISICKNRHSAIKTLFFYNWIKSGVIFVNDLVFRNGKLDEEFILNKVKLKSNILIELTLLKAALKPYLTMIENHTPPVNHLVNEFNPITTKTYYTRLLSLKISPPPCEHKWLAYLHKEEFDFQNTYIKKIKKIKEKKLAEFNYKVLHWTLACNKNLNIWRISPTDQCDVCGEIQDIPHLLFICSHSKYYWGILENIFKTTVSIQDVIFGRNDDIFNLCTTIMSFTLYKEWLVFKNDNVTRTHLSSVIFLLGDLQVRRETYTNLGWLEIADVLNDIENALCAELVNSSR